MLQNKKILLGITGSIAAYKSALIVRLLVKAGAEVKVIMTRDAAGFITPLTISTLSGQPVLTDLIHNDSWANHVMLGRWADVMLVAPLTCNTLSKMAHGGCDNLLLATYLSATCPVVLAPAMDEDMWKHPSTRASLEAVRTYGNHVISVNHGELASGLVGEGRMAEPEEIISWLENHFSNTEQLSGKKVLITAGPTREALDPVRFISNHSTGKMGIALAEKFKAQGAEVHLILGPGTNIPLPDVKITHVITAADMLSASKDAFQVHDIAVMCAAVADYTPVTVSGEKIKKQDELLTIELKKTTDILKELGKMKQPNQVLVGFALETHDEQVNALKKLKEKNADLIVLNSLKDEGAGFGFDTNKITIFDRQGREHHFEKASKQQVATDIINTIIQFSHA